MKDTELTQMKFFMDMSEHQISAREFFGSYLLESLERNFGLDKAVIFYFDTEGEFLSWVCKDGLRVADLKHPYLNIINNDVVRHKIYQDACRDRLTYFNVVPRLYRATDIISSIDYEHAAYVRFMEENFHTHYSLTFAFGINAYIQISFFKTLEEGDFNEEEINKLSEIYVYIANAYKTFKKYEQSKIISEIQSKIIASGEKEYFIIDSFQHILYCDGNTQKQMEDFLGIPINKQIESLTVCNWLAFLLGDSTDLKNVNTRSVALKNYVFKIHAYDQTYSNRIVDRYYWITLSKIGPEKSFDSSGGLYHLTKTEQRVAEMIYRGITYKEIACEMVVSYHTVKKHVENIYNKCGVNCRYELYKLIERMNSKPEE
jgi:DNA-binding CsgD family transcriptional regulator